MNMYLYENRIFLLTVLRQLEQSLYIDQHFLCILLSPVRHRNHLGSAKLGIFMETFMKQKKITIL